MASYSRELKEQIVRKMMPPNSQNVASIRRNNGVRFTFLRQNHKRQPGPRYRTEYDTLGRKGWVDDPDTGLWRYRVDALGQVIEQTSPRGTCTQMRYDARGRLWQRSDYAGATCAGAADPDARSEWQFDSAANGIGRLAGERTWNNGVGAS